MICGKNLFLAATAVTFGQTSEAKKTVWPPSEMLLRHPLLLLLLIVAGSEGFGPGQFALFIKSQGNCVKSSARRCGPQMHVAGGDSADGNAQNQLNSAAAMCGVGGVPDFLQQQKELVKFLPMQRACFLPDSQRDTLTM